MKKLILALAFCVSLCANAQLTVYENGQVRVGNNTTPNKLSATLDVSDSETDLFSSTHMPAGSISFGSGTGALLSGCSSVGHINLYGGRSLEIGVGTVRNVFKMSQEISSVPVCASFSCDVRATSFLTTSDARMKKNVASLNDLFEKLTDVNAVSYNLSGGSQEGKSTFAAKDSDTQNAIVADDRLHFGFIAQEIKEIYPNLVVEDEEGLLAIDYAGFIPILVDAYKNLAEKLKEQEDVIKSLTNQRSPSFMPASVNGIDEESAVLKQNRPNPFNVSTSIECFLPQNVASAFICIYDLQGKQVHKIDILNRGNVINIIDASYFAPGMYIYSLITDGIEIDSKRMIITD